MLLGCLTLTIREINDPTRSTIKLFARWNDATHGSFWKGVLVWRLNWFGNSRACFVHRSATGGFVAWVRECLLTHSSLYNWASISVTDLRRTVLRITFRALRSQAEPSVGKILCRSTRLNEMQYFFYSEWIIRSPFYSRCWVFTFPTSSHVRWGPRPARLFYQSVGPVRVPVRELTLVQVPACGVRRVQQTMISRR